MAKVIGIGGVFFRSGDPERLFGPVREHLERSGFEVEVVAIDYEFRRADDHAGNRVMRVRRTRSGQA